MLLWGGGGISCLVFFLLALVVAALENESL